MELTDRKRQILKIVVEEYVAAAEPVGSKAIAQRMPGKISSATIRNELADLTEMGYLEQPHTSAGRVPSAKGYRLYVNELMERRSLSREEEEKLNTSLAEKLAGTDQVMARAGQMVSSFVGYPAYAVADHKTAATVRRFELIPVDQSSFIAVVMLSDSQVKSQLLPLQLPVADGGLPDMSHLLNAHFTGIGPEDMNGRLMSLSEQVSGQWFLPLNQVVEYAGRLLKEANSQEVFTGGAKEFLRFPEYRDADKAHDLMTFMVDNKEQLPAPTEGGPVQILIGPENLNEALRDSSVVVASYDIGDNMRGLVGVVGPTRMDYATLQRAWAACSGRTSCPPRRTRKHERKRQQYPSGESAGESGNPGNRESGHCAGNGGGDLHRHPGSDGKNGTAGQDGVRRQRQISAAGSGV